MEQRLHRYGYEFAVAEIQAALDTFRARLTPADLRVIRLADPLPGFSAASPLGFVAEAQYWGGGAIGWGTRSRDSLVPATTGAPATAGGLARRAAHAARLALGEG
jgi:hypothetical protein